MRKFLVVVTIALFFLVIWVTYASAVYDPLSVPNNLFGIHIADINDLGEASTLVNSSGGDWGYVTFVIQAGERDPQKWKPIFIRMRDLHLVPIVRVATRSVLIGWERPSLDDIDGWVSFLDSLPWPTKNRYVIIANEPNHAKEWGGVVSPEEYARYLKNFSLKLRGASDKFFILPAGLDASAPNSFFTMDEELFIRRMLRAEPVIFDFIDGWTSHSYPNPKFSGSEYAQGRKTIRTYQWELELIKKLGIAKDLPVFITETGWVNTLGEKTISQKFKYAFENVWTDKNIVAITPFILNYQGGPFDIFSWKSSQAEYYDFYYKIKDLPKKEGKPALEPPPTPVPTATPVPTRALTPYPTPAPSVSFWDRILIFFKFRFKRLFLLRA